MRKAMFASGQFYSNFPVATLILALIFWLHSMPLHRLDL
jgi:hypothetical protein